MVYGCFICNQVASADRSLHGFPRETERKKEWCSILECNLEDLPRKPLLCSDHFRKKDYTGFCLKKNALPSPTKTQNKKPVPLPAVPLPAVPLPAVPLPGIKRLACKRAVNPCPLKKRTVGDFTILPCDTPLTVTIADNFEGEFQFIQMGMIPSPLQMDLLSPIYTQILLQIGPLVVSPILTSNFKNSDESISSSTICTPKTSSSPPNISIPLTVPLPSKVVPLPVGDDEISLPGVTPATIRSKKYNQRTPVVDTPTANTTHELSALADQVIYDNNDKENVRPVKDLTPKTKLIKSLKAKLSKRNFDLRKCKKKLQLCPSSPYEIISKYFGNANEEFKLVLVSQCQRFKTKPETRGKNYNDYEISSAFTILYHCKKDGYRYLRKTGFKLPSLSTVRRWIGKIDVSPGISKTTLSCIKNCTLGFSEKERDCILLWDEMRIKQLVQYNRKRDSLIGVVDYGDDETNPDLLANETLVFMVKGIYKGWCFPLSYHFSNGPTGEHTINRILLSAIDELMGIGLKVRVVLCDQGITNQNVFRLQQITTEQNYINRNGSKIYFMHDPCHIIKLVRTHLKKHGFKFDKSVPSPFNVPSPLQLTVQGSANWSTIAEFYSKDIGTENRLAPRLTDLHFQLTDITTMKVKLATQVLSNTVAQGICFMVNQKLMSEESLDTAFFVKMMNDMFDLMNISQPRDKVPLKSGLDYYKNLEKLKSFKTWVDTWKCADGKRLPDCVKGLQITLKTLHDLSLDLEADGYTYVLTRRIQQDDLEHYFGSQRSAIGNANNPTAWQFSIAWRKLLLNRVAVVSEKANCQESTLTEHNLFKFSALTKLLNELNPLGSLSQVKSLETTEFVTDPVTGHPDESSEFESGSSDSEYITELVQLSTLDVWNDFFNLSENEEISSKDENVAVYMGNWAAKAVSKRTKCTRCKSAIFEDSSNSSLEVEEEWTKLKALYPDAFTDPKEYAYGHRINQESRRVFIELFQFFRNATSSVNYSSRGIRENIFNYLMQHKSIQKWVLQDIECKLHRTRIIDKILLAKIFHLVKELNKKHLVIRSTRTSIGKLRHM